MENRKVPELKSIAKERGLKGYSKMRKAELVALLSTPIEDLHTIPDVPAPTPFQAIKREIVKKTEKFTD